MKIIKKILLVCLALFLTLLDISFFSAMPIGNATILSLFSFVLIFAFLGDFSNCLIFSISAVMFFSIFSSLPTWFLLFSFFIIPEGIFYLRQNFFPELAVFSATIFFFSADFVFEFLLLLTYGQLNFNNLRTLGCFVLINTCFTAALYFVIKKVKKNTNLDEVKFI